MRPEDWTTATALANVFRVVAFGCSAVGVLAVCALLWWSNGTPDDRFAIAVMGGAIAGTPFVLARALDEFLREKREAQLYSRPH